LSDRIAVEPPEYGRKIAGFHWLLRISEKFLKTVVESGERKGAGGQCGGLRQSSRQNRMEFSSVAFPFDPNMDLERG